MTKRILIVGGVAAGPAAAARLKRLRPDWEVILLEQGRHISYGTCSMPYYLGGYPEAAEDLIHFTPEEFEKQKGCRVFVRHRAESIQPTLKKLHVRNLETGSLDEHRYDKLLLATGASPKKEGVPSTEASNVFVLKTLEDAIKIREWVRIYDPRRIVILGAGFVGLELAEAMSRYATDITLVHRSDMPLNRAEPEIRSIVLDEIRSAGIRFMPSTTIQSFDSVDGIVKGVQTSAGPVETDMVLVAAGFQPNSVLAAAAKIRCGSLGGILVDPKMRTNLDDIYAAGACTEIRHAVSNRYVFHPLAQAANQMGRVAAANMAGKHDELNAIYGTAAVKVFRLEVASVGLTLQDALEAGLDASSSSVKSRSRGRNHVDSKPLFAKVVFHRRTRRILGAHLVGEEGAALRVNSAAVAIAKHMTVEEFVKIDLMYTPPFASLWDPLTLAARQASGA